MIAGTAVLGPCAFQCLLQTMNQPQEKLPHHKNSSCQHVVRAMTIIQQSCCRQLPGLDIINAGVRLQQSQSGSATQESLISAISHSRLHEPIISFNLARRLSRKCQCLWNTTRKLQHWEPVGPLTLYLRMPCCQEEKKNTSHWGYIMDLHLQEKSQHDKPLSTLITDQHIFSQNTLCYPTALSREWRF